MPNDGLITENMDLSHIHLAVLQLFEKILKRETILELSKTIHNSEFSEFFDQLEQF